MIDPALDVPLALWGGAECTINRVGDHFKDQTIASGHDARTDDLDRFAGLGITAIRYPLLWESFELCQDRKQLWEWHDERLARLRGRGVRPILGLVHHGSGLRATNLLAPDFAAGLAQHAAEAAGRYPWVQDWTPVNEPLTTARFSALYGLWYPHLRDETAFWLALVNQIDAVRAAMAAVRSINPRARLIQTEDLGYAAAWYRERSLATAAAYVPLSFAPGEAYQFDWSHEIVIIAGATTTVKVAHGGGSPARFTPGCWASRSASCLSCRLCCTGLTAPALRRRTRWSMARLPRLSLAI